MQQRAAIRSSSWVQTVLHMRRRQRWVNFITVTTGTSDTNIQRKQCDWRICRVLESYRTCATYRRHHVDARAYTMRLWLSRYMPSYLKKLASWATLRRLRASMEQTSMACQETRTAYSSSSSRGKSQHPTHTATQLSCPSLQTDNYSGECCNRVMQLDSVRACMHTCNPCRVQMHICCSCGAITLDLCDCTLHHLPSQSCTLVSANYCLASCRACCTTLWNAWA